MMETTPVDCPSPPVLMLTIEGPVERDEDLTVYRRGTLDIDGKRPVDDSRPSVGRCTLPSNGVEWTKVTAVILKREAGRRTDLTALWCLLSATVIVTHDWPADFTRWKINKRIRKCSRTVAKLEFSSAG